MICPNCKKSKKESDFSKHSSEGRQAWCKSCYNDYRAEYFCSEHGVIIEMFRGARKYTKNKKLEPITFNFDEFEKWVKKQPSFRAMYIEWLSSDCDPSYKISIDRIDRWGSYTFDNMQLVLWPDNLDRPKVPTEQHKHNKAVCQYTKEGEFVKEYVSISIAAAAVGAQISNVSGCIKKKEASAGGFKWRLKGDKF